MNPRTKPRRQTRVPRHNERKPPFPANPSDVPPKRGPVQTPVVPQHHASRTGRQVRN
jgi:hypothetical protein